MTSILRFEEMEYVQVQSYGNNKGSKTNFIVSAEGGQDKVLKTLQFLQSLRTRDPPEQQAISEEVSNAVIRAQGPEPFAKL